MNCFYLVCLHAMDQSLSGLPLIFYADELQLFLSFKGADRLSDSKLQLKVCINDICRWMVFNELKLNQDKTEL